VRFTLAKNDTPAMENFMSSLNLMKHKEACNLDTERRLILDPKHINDWSIRDQCFAEVAAVFDALILQASFFAEGDCCLQEEAWSGTNRSVKDMIDMIAAVALSLRMKILAKMVNSSDLPDELFDQLLKTTSDQETLAVAPVVGVTQTAEG
jgi:hypothetical protein